MQSERYFQSIPDIIHQDFDLTCFESANTKSLLEKVQLPNTVSLHVCKGDYSIAAQLPLSYYQKAVRCSYSKHEDTLLMSHCAHHIITNSTFSWWAAWLSILHPEKLVFAPCSWPYGWPYAI